MKLYKERLAEAQIYYNAGLERVRTILSPDGQKFLPGIFVRIATDLSNEHMQHFQSDRYARVNYTYAHAYGGKNIDSYSLLVRYDDGHWSEVAWYYESQLEAITDPIIIEKLKTEIEK